ncbi:unnamed protein product, partial [Ectocarpus sp. 13 AM-2016]
KKTCISVPLRRRCGIITDASGAFPDRGASDRDGSPSEYRDQYAMSRTQIQPRYSIALFECIHTRHQNSTYCAKYRELRAGTPAYWTTTGGTWKDPSKITTHECMA